MSKKPYSIYPRKRKNGKPVYYSQFRNSDVSCLTAKSTQQTPRSRAEAWCIDYLKAGGIVKKKRMLLLKIFQRIFIHLQGHGLLIRKLVEKELV